MATDNPLSTDEQFCPLCGFEPVACGCREALSGDTSDPIPEGSLAEMLNELEYEEDPRE